MRRLALATATLVLLAPAATAHAADPAVDRAIDAVVRAGLPRAEAEVTDVRRSPLGLHVRGVQARRGVPVHGTGWVVTSRGGRVVDVALDRSRLRGGPARGALGREVAVRVATTALGVRPFRVRAERLLVRRGARLADTWRVSVVSLRPALATAVDVDAGSGRVVDRVATERHVDAVGKVFDPNPVVTTRNAGLRQPLEQGQAVDADLDSPELTAARRDLPVLGLDETALTSGRLVGPWVTVLGMAGYNVVTRNLFDFTRSDPRFEGLMVYAHLDGLQRRFRALGLEDVNAESQDVVATRVEGFDNSFYQPGNDLMLMGAGGVDDGEDAEVIVHEYGHAVHDAQVPGWGDTAEGGAMGEGFGDWLAAAHFADRNEGFGDLCIMDWDATSYSSATPPCLRRMDTGKRYPKDVVNAVHADGELWSQFLWAVRAGLTGGTPREQSDAALRLVLSSHELLTPQAEFGDAVGALRTAAQALGGDAWRTVVEREATATGFPLTGEAGA